MTGISGTPLNSQIAEENPSLVSLTEDDLSILVFCEQHWNLSGSLPTVERAEELGLPRESYEKALLKAEFQEALSERGIVLRNAKQGFKAKTLTVEQMAVANTLLDLTDTRSQKKKLQDLGISTVKYQAWLKDPVFRSYLQERAENVLGDNAHEVNLALLDAVRSGNVKAIEYYNEYTGRYVPVSKRPSSSSPQVDVHGILTAMIEIIQKRVKDPEIQGLIGQDVKELIERNAIAHALSNPSALPQQPPVGQQEKKALPEGLNL